MYGNTILKEDGNEYAILKTIYIFVSLLKCDYFSVNRIYNSMSMS